MGRNKQPPKKEVYRPDVQLHPKQVKSEELPANQVEKFKQKLLEAVKRGVILEDNVYKEHREKMEGAKIEKILKAKEIAF